VNILLIEDSPDDQDLLMELFEETSFKPSVLTVTNNLRDGMQHMSKEKTDILLLDLSLPDSFMLKGFSKVKRQFPELPVIIMTVLKDKEIALKAIQKGAQDYLVKGEFEGFLLEKTINYAIERHKLFIKRKQVEKKLEDYTAYLEKTNKNLKKNSFDLEKVNKELKQSEMNIIKTIVVTQEKERSRYSIDLHDGLSQVLIAIKINLEVLEAQLKDQKITENNRLYFSIGLLDNAIKELKNITYDLMPRILEDFGLIAALEELFEKIVNTKSIKIDFYKPPLKKKLNKVVEIGLYRITQEFMSNTLKHSKAQAIKIYLILDKNKKIILKIEDDGIGFRTAKLEKMKGQGLRNTEIRVKALNGFYTLDSSVGKGTKLYVEIPMA